MNKRYINDAIIFSKLYIEKYDVEETYKNKIIKKNKTIGNLQKTIHKYKNEINELLGYIKYPTYPTYKLI
tara:strand:+ start:2358 stop:2567 length:210 start_codon:yes stop_codon:yes gene_type:complete